MRSRNQKIRQILGRISPMTKAAKNIISLGIESKQWLACVMICAMLSPVFALPVGASVRYSTSETSGEFEPVNERLPVWTQTWRELNAKIEAWTTPLRAENISFGDDGDDKKKKKKKDAKKEVKSEEKTDKDANNKNPKTENSNAKTEEKSVSNTETAKTEKDSPKAAVENKTELKPKAENAIAPRVPFLNQLPDNERGSIYSFENNVGGAAAYSQPDSSNLAAALPIKHRVGLANFSFGLPLAGLSGRGIDAGVGMTYNSRTWNKSCSEYDENFNCTQDHFTYDVDQSWIAPGFTSGLGYLQSNLVTRNVIMMNGSNTVVRTLTEIIPEGITDADGNRHQISCKSYAQIPGGHLSEFYCTAFETVDGSFVKVIRNGSNYNIGGTINYNNISFTVIYPNGSRVQYANPFGSGNSRKHYPYRIQDSNGNQIHIAYKNDQSGRIDYITDTLNRRIKFHYEVDDYGNPDKLVAVTIPGMGATEEIQTVRFYYETVPLQAGGFESSAQVTAPSTIRVLKYVYMPATKTGYKYEYHPHYGMIKKITRFVGMTANGNLTSSTGEINFEGLLAASTEYDYPSGSTPQSDVPKYTKRTDNWQGATSPQETLYNTITDSNGDNITKITVKDTGFDVMTESVSGSDGLLKQSSVKKMSSSGSFLQLMSRADYTWAGSSKLTSLTATNDAGLAKVTDFEYDQYYNQTSIKEYDYASPVGSRGSLLRTTEIGYVTDAGWISNRFLSLPKSVKTIVGGATVSKTLYEYDHNGDAGPLTLRGESLFGHDPAYNPESGVYEESTAYRGNVTAVGNMIDVNASTIADDPNADVTQYNYDILGNVVSSTLSCCQLRTYNYDTEHFAFMISQTSGTAPTQLTTSATYNRNTGLMLTSTDENLQVTSYEYETDTLRQKKVNYPNGGYVQTEYSDKLVTNTNDLLPGFVRTTTTLEANKFAQSYNYFNGRGQGIRSAAQTPDGWSISAVEFDTLGRPIKSYNPFYASTPTGAIPTNTKFTEVLNYDALGRTTSVSLQDNTTVSTTFGATPVGTNKTFVTVTDQAGKQRRQVADSLGRVVRVDEPDANGNLGTVDAPNQPTSYEYDGNDNLKKVTQSDGTATQERLFKYDSLSRLTHEKQVEAIPTLNDLGVIQTSGGLWTKVLKYNADGLLTDGYDARGINTHFSYDTLNRASSVTFTGETGYTTPTINYTYDEERSGFYNKGRLTKVTTAAVAGTQGTPATEQVYDFDKMGQVVKHQQKIDNQSYLLEYGYNLAGQLTSEKYPSGRIVNVGYDAHGRLSTVSDANRTYLNGIAFNNQTLPSQMNFGNGTNQTFAFNDRLQMTNQTLSKASEILQKYDYGYGQIDSNGNLDTTKNNGQLAKIESYIGANKQWTQKFSYDSIGRLSESKEYRGDTNALSYKQKFDFDRFGNLYRKTASNPTSGQETPLLYTPIEDADIDRTTNRFTTATGTTYNEAGQVVTDNKFRTMSFGYDANGRMVKATKASFPDALTIYDALGNRVATKVDDVWQFTIYDAFGRLVAEYGGLTPSDEGGVKYVLQDWQGSVRGVLSNSGFIQSRTDYQAFGEEIQSGVGLRTVAQGFGSGINNRQGYGLTEKDDSTGLNHTWFRKNENRAGRWTSPDPSNGSMSLGNPQSFNRYSYVEGQPTNFVDPSGLQIAIPYKNTGIFHVEIRISWFDQMWEDYWGANNGGEFGWMFDPPVGGGFEFGGDTPAVEPSQDKINKCLDDVFGEGVVRFTGSSIDSSNNFLKLSLSINGGSYDIKVYFNRYSSERLGEEYELENGLPVSGLKQTGYASNNAQAGNTVSVDIANNLGENVTGIGIFALVFHEIGNGIGLIVFNSKSKSEKENKSPFKLDIKPTTGGDTDTGVAFERCLFGGIVGLRTGNVGNSR